ncbi:MAG: SusF/SusE family outer membrane protein [Williamsia sp.]|nr:SusF/SusE family outer membrane protein [Williamsia sp.]
MKLIFSLASPAKRGAALICFLFTASLFLLSSCSKELKAGKPIALTYDKVYLIGDATTAGWTIANALPMTKSADNTKVFTWTGPLAAGEIKFPTALNFSSDTFAAATASQSVSNNKAQLSPGGNPDVKWKLASTEAGTYKITLNTGDLTVVFQKQ